MSVLLFNSLVQGKYEQLHFMGKLLWSVQGYFKGNNFLMDIAGHILSCGRVW